MKFTKRTTYYPFPVYEFNLPAGHSCPFAKDCLVKVDRKTGKQDYTGGKYRCYASVSERYPAVRESRWTNFEELLEGKEIILPKGATHVRIHGSGDFFSQAYFDKWLEVCRNNPQVHFWAFTKSIQYWINRINDIPDNLVLTASYGSKQDELIKEYGLRNATVYDEPRDVPNGMGIDSDDSLAMKKGDSFALLNNFKNRKNK